jgi:hypothetical protein
LIITFLRSVIWPDANRQTLFIDFIFIQVITNGFQDSDWLLTNIKVRVSPINRHKKRACPARVAEAGQENIETVHEPKPIQTAKFP